MLMSQYRAAVKNHYGNTSPSTAISTQIDDFINSAYVEMCRTLNNGFWNRRVFSFPTMAQLTGAAAAATGVTVTGGSKTATFGASSRIDRSMIGSLLRVSDDQDSYLIVDVTATTTAIIEPAYTGAAVGTAVSNESFTLTGWNYRLPPDVTTPFVLTQSQSPTKLFAVFPRLLDRAIPDPSLLAQLGDPYLYAVTYGAGLPDFWGSNVQTQIGSTAGNVTIVQGAFTVAGGSQTPDFANAVISTAASAATSLLPGMFMRVAGDSRYYRIRSVSTGTALTLDEPFRGTSVTNAAFRIMPGDAPWVRLYPLPDSRYHIDCVYHASPPPMTMDEEEPRLPHDFHDVILDGALLNLFRYLNNPPMVDRFEKQFDAGLQRLRSRSDAEDETVWRYQPAYGGPGVYMDGIPYGQLPWSITT